MKLSPKGMLMLGLAALLLGGAAARADFVLSVTELDASNNVVATGGITTSGQVLSFVSSVGDFTIMVTGFSNSNMATSQGVVTNVTLDISSGNVSNKNTLRL